MKVSILIPTFQQRHTAICAVRSALAQDHPNLEVIVSDDASTDGTADAVESLASDPRLTVHRGERNVGRVANYRRGLFEFATGDYVLLLDGDDWLVATDYVRRAANLASRGGCALVFGRQRIFDGATGRFREATGNEGLCEINDGDALFLALPISEIALFHLSCLYERKRAIDLDFYREDILSSDFESLHRLLVGSRVGFVDCVAGVWRRHANSAIARTRPEERIANLRSIMGPFEHARDSGRFEIRALEAWRTAMLARKGRQDFRALLRARERRAAARYLVAIARQSPRAALRIGASPRVWLSAWLG